MLPLHSACHTGDMVYVQQYLNEGYKPTEPDSVSISVAVALVLSSVMLSKATWCSLKFVRPVREVALQYTSCVSVVVTNEE